jgi:hypothetical protein
MSRTAPTRVPRVTAAIRQHPAATWRKAVRPHSCKGRLRVSRLRPIAVGRQAHQRLFVCVRVIDRCKADSKLNPENCVAGSESNFAAHCHRTGNRTFIMLTRCIVRTARDTRHRAW